ncbi:MAG: hypothetical protein OEM15_11960 [Myxococcales bacterium]|nr:hypothetical protein [Myxococcales bacterium]MDH3484483.1 hypothetical protein [Myxococcales bacterium]
MIEYDFIPPEQSSLDQLQTEVILLPFFEDERPLRGAAGLVDWRLCGALSRRLAGGDLRGNFGEKSWAITLPKLKAERLLLFGLGQSKAFDRRVAEEACALIAKAINEAKLATAALALPGRSMDRLSAEDAMQHWLDATPRDLALGELTIIEHRADHKPLESVIDGLRRQAESPLG